MFRKGVIKGVIKGETKGNDTEGVIKARASVHISGAKTLYSITSISKLYTGKFRTCDGATCTRKVNPLQGIAWGGL